MDPVYMEFSPVYDNQVAFTIPFSVPVTARFLVNGQEQYPNKDYSINDGQIIKWLSPDFRLLTTDVLRISNF